jgi:hypothetical protein
MKETTFGDAWKRQFSEPSASTFLLLLLIADFTFILLHFLRLTPVINDYLFSLERDLGYSEFYQYIKELWIFVLIIALLIKTRSAGYSIWAVLFLYLLFDDALQIHETFGGYIAASLEFTPFGGLRAQDFGELAVSTMAAAIVLSCLLFFYIRGLADFKKATRHLLLFLVAIAFFGIFIDMLHVALEMGWKISFLLGTLEDGGEMFVMSFVTWYVFLLHVRDGNSGINLRQSFSKAFS